MKTGAFPTHSPVLSTPAHLHFRNIHKNRGTKILLGCVFCVPTLWVIYRARGSSICCKGVISSIPQLPLLPPSQPNQGSFIADKLTG
jgi:hypothetical protein